MRVREGGREELGSREKGGKGRKRERESQRRRELGTRKKEMKLAREVERKDVIPHQCWVEQSPP